MRKASGHLFGETSDAIREAVALAVGRSLSPESIREACHFGFKHVFG